MIRSAHPASSPATTRRAPEYALTRRTSVPAKPCWLSASPPDGAEGHKMENLSPAGDLVEAAANLFAALRRLDATGVETIAVMPIPEAGLGEAINDRLRRAAAER